MPRGVKKILTENDIEEKVSEIDAKIIKHQKTITELKTKRKALLDSKNAVLYEGLLEEIRRSGKSPDEIMELIKNN